MGYASLGRMQALHALEPSSQMLATNAPREFANFSSIAIQIGGLLACHCTACVVGMLS